MKKKTLPPFLGVIFLLATMGSSTRTWKIIPRNIKEDSVQKVKRVEATKVHLDEAKDAGVRKLPLQGEAALPELPVAEAPMIAAVDVQLAEADDAGLRKVPLQGEVALPKLPSMIAAADVQPAEAEDAGLRKVPLQGDVALPKLPVPEAPMIAAADVQLAEAEDAGLWKVPLQGEVALPKLLVPEAPMMQSNRPPTTTVALAVLEGMLKAKHGKLLSADIALSQLTEAARASTDFGYAVAFLNSKNLLLAELDSLREDVNNLAKQVVVARMKEVQAAG